MYIWRSEWTTTLQMQTLKTRVWTAIDRNKNRFCGFYDRFCGFYASWGNKRQCAATFAPDSVCTDRNFAYEDELGINIVSKADIIQNDYKEKNKYYSCGICNYFNKFLANPEI